MLQSLRVKNLALMEEAEVEFGPGLNILTGETGAGKSLLIGSVNLALGGRFDSSMLRQGTDTATVELIFKEDSPSVTAILKELEVEPEEDGTIILTRKMTSSKSTCRINGETVTAKQVRELAGELLDIHGQHEHQSLLHKKKHLEILDAFCGEALSEILRTLRQEFKDWKELKATLLSEEEAADTQDREQSLAEFEVKEIQDAALQIGEDELLEARYNKMRHARQIMEALGEAYGATGSDGEGAASCISHALRSLHNVASFDPEIGRMQEQLQEIESLLSDYNRDVSSYMDDCEFDEADFRETEERLNLINHMKDRYGATIEAVLEYLEKQEAYLNKLANYEAYMEDLRKKVAVAYETLFKTCQKAGELRRKKAKELAGILTEKLVSLNFLSVDFQIAVTTADNITALGNDDVEFLISTNPGEPVKPLGQVASGGELSRVMLAIKTVMAGQDRIDSLIFDEIDAGISGRTAWKVAEQMHLVAKCHQVLCITHLPQIASMADTHLLIEKSANASGTATSIREVSGEESNQELARLLGSDDLSEAALENARDMRTKALEYKTLALKNA